MLVSIHAPWEGCDLPSLTMRYALNSFNSRTLGRVRQLKKGQSFDAYLFQFTHPGKGATLLHGQILLLLMFQFTHPGKGATTIYHQPQGRGRFQFTHPGKGATF